MENSPCIFTNDWWLDATCGKGNWKRVEADGFGTFPIHQRKKGAFTFLLMPPLTPWYEAEIRYPDGIKYTNKLAFEKDAFTELINKLPATDYIQFQFSPALTNWLPFHWQGYKQTTRYTYTIDTNKTLDELFAGIGSKKTKVNKAKSLGITVAEELQFLNFYKLYNDTLSRNEGQTVYSEELLKRVVEAVKINNSGTVLSATDSQGNIHASALFVWDKHYLYYLLSGNSNQHKNSGALSLLIWEGIVLAHSKGLTFNFEGSMIEPVEHFFRSFGAIQTPYFKLEKYNSTLLKIINFFVKKL